ncbi:dTDP-4-dehydrorhamnose reductase [Riemerella columbipharyngis]|uniref:dTDP-4-dehydrorhamnose reductase n=1 Tax=Riemerella columbipharyngis TaxID=1071918 RepID=A0A1G7DM52_9FLAO|nr:dTDP-4-dehydrorhamnose reductase [Riemerella columbipharyngis]SDE52160.1 dTDP-4-dehydrorhamnose reductase [Riemerella columbipharyngis]
MLKKILITGGSGQLANCFNKLKDNFPKYDFIFKTSKELDITNPENIETILEEEKPDFCINTAAYTAVDLAEKESNKAFAVNAKGVGCLAELCKEYGVCFIHISTDYVFDGETSLPYSEDDFTNPLGIYGQSKREGEVLAMEKNPKSIIIRTSWLYSEFNKNFVKTMLSLFKQKKELNIVNDQFGQPTNANDLANAVMQIIEKGAKTSGIFHFSNYPETTWYEFASKIKDFSGSNITLKPIPTEQYPTPAKRPKRSTFCLEKIEQIYGIELIHWENSLEDCIAECNTR